MGPRGSRMCVWAIVFGQRHYKNEVLSKNVAAQDRCGKTNEPRSGFKTRNGHTNVPTKDEQERQKKNGNIERHGIHRVPDGGALVLSIKSGLFFRKTSQKRHFCFSRQSHRGANRTKFLYDDPRSKKIFFNNLTKNGVSSTLVEY